MRPGGRPMRRRANKRARRPAGLLPVLAPSALIAPARLSAAELEAGSLCSIQAGAHLRSELPAQAAPDDVDIFLEVVADDVRRLRLGKTIMQIFRPQEHVVDKLVFKPGARNPAELIDFVAQKTRRRYLCMPPTGASGAIGEQVRDEEIAEPGARGGELVGLLFNAEDRLVDVGPVEIRFQTGNDRTILPIVAGVAADDTARSRRVERRCEIERRVAPTAAAVDADIEPGPIG